MKDLLDARKPESSTLPGFRWRSETGYAETFHVFTTSATLCAESSG